MEFVYQDLPALPYLALALAAALLLALSYRSELQQVPCTRDAAVLISGCDTGFGQALTQRLSKRGFTILAGCFTKEGEAAWRGVEGVHSFRLDVSNDASVEEAATRLRHWLTCDPSRRLHALVNNAGIAAGGCVDWCTMAEYRRAMDVNFLGHVAMTKATLPFLLSPPDWSLPRPRIVNVTSIAGILAAPGMSAYCATKYALEAFSDSLRRELHYWAIPVAIIEPSFLGTPILAPLAEIMVAKWAALPADVRNRWGEEYHESGIARVRGIVGGAESPTLAVDAMEHAVCAASPRIRYKVGTLGKYLAPLLIALPAGLTDVLLSTFNFGPVPASAKIRVVDSDGTASDSSPGLGATNRVLQKAASGEPVAPEKKPAHGGGRAGRSPSGSRRRGGRRTDE